MKETQETQFPSLGRDDPLKEEMATHSSILAWIIPWTEEPGELWSMRSQESDMTEQLSAHTHTHTFIQNGKLKWNKVRVMQSCPTLCDPVSCRLPDSSVHGISQARILEWVIISFSRGSSQSRDGIHVSCTAGRFFAVWATCQYRRHRDILG